MAVASLELGLGYSFSNPTIHLFYPPPPSPPKKGILFDFSWDIKMSILGGKQDVLWDSRKVENTVAYSLSGGHTILLTKLKSIFFDGETVIQ